MKAEKEARAMNSMFKLFLELTKREMTMNEMTELTGHSRRGVYRFLYIFEENGMKVSRQKGINRPVVEFI